MLRYKSMEEKEPGSTGSIEACQEGCQLSINPSRALVHNADAPPSLLASSRISRQPLGVRRSPAQILKASKTSKTTSTFSDHGTLKNPGPGPVKAAPSQLGGAEASCSPLGRLPTSPERSQMGRYAPADVVRDLTECVDDVRASWLLARVV